MKYLIPMGCILGAQIFAYYYNSILTPKEHMKLSRPLKSKLIKEYLIIDLATCAMPLMDSKTLSLLLVVHTKMFFKNIFIYYTAFEYDCIDYLRLVWELQSIVQSAITSYKNARLEDFHNLINDFKNLVKTLFVYLNSNYLNYPIVVRLIVVFEVLDVLFTNLASYVMNLQLPCDIIDIVKSYINCFSYINMNKCPLTSLQFCERELMFCQNSFLSKFWN